MKRAINRFLHDERGATAIEYAMIASLLFVAILASWPQFYDGFMASWTNAGTTMKNALK